VDEAVQPPVAKPDNKAGNHYTLTAHQGTHSFSVANADFRDEIRRNTSGAIIRRAGALTCGDRCRNLIVGVPVVVVI
jgi:hypothetical protein